MAYASGAFDTRDNLSDHGGPASLVIDLHGVTLRLLAARHGTHFQGLAEASRRLPWPLPCASWDLFSGLCWQTTPTTRRRRRGLAGKAAAFPAWFGRGLAAGYFDERKSVSEVESKGDDRT